MPANTSPIFTLTPNVDYATVTAANTSTSGSGTIATDMFKAFTCGANGSFIKFIRCIPTATATTTTTATRATFYKSTQTSGATTNANTVAFAEQSLAAISADATTAAATTYDVPVNEAFPPNQTILVSNYHTPAANSAWKFVVFGGDY